MYLVYCCCTKTVKTLRSGELLVKCSRKSLSDNLLALKTFVNIIVKVSPHSSLNSFKGVIRYRDLYGVPDQEILDNLKPQNVTQVHRIKIKRNKELHETNTFVLTFGTATLPKSLKVGFLNVKIDIYTPNPLRCFRWQQFGHHEDSCKKTSPVCPRCAVEGHDEDSCEEDSRNFVCRNCGVIITATQKTALHGKKKRKYSGWNIPKTSLSLRLENRLSYRCLPPHFPMLPS